MFKKIQYLFLLGVFYLLVGCTFTPSYSTIQIPTLIPAANTPVPLIVYVTATPFASSNSGVTATPVAPYSTPTPVISNASIVVTQVEDIGGGHAIVHWTPSGNFPSGYIVVWSTTNQNPVYPTDLNNYSGDPASRSALITAQIGKIYYLRVCRAVNNTCDVYSNLAIFALRNIPTATPVKTYSGSSSTSATSTSTAGSYDSSGTAVSSSSGITITSITESATGKAKIVWTATGTFSSGFDIVYSTSYTLPYVGGYPYYIVSDSTARSAYVDGTTGTTYYYRVCRRSDTTCDIYSNSYTFAYSGTAPTAVPTATPDGSTISITRIDNTTLGSANVVWAPTGDFPNGFAVLYSKTVASPTLALSDGQSYVAAGVTSAPISGIPGMTYHVTVCKYNGSTCTYYSLPMDVVLTPDPATISTPEVKDTGTGTASVTWTTTGTFPDGYKVLLSKTNPPAVSTDVVATSVEATKTAAISGTPGTQYYVQICKVYGSTCSVLSVAKSFTFGKITITGIVDTSSGSASLTFAPVGGPFTDYRVLYSDTVASPTLGAAGVLPPVVSTTSSTATVTGTTGTSYHFTVCAYNGSTCTVYSPVFNFTFGSSLVLSIGGTGSNVNLTWVGPDPSSPTFSAYHIFGTGTNTGTFSDLSQVSSSTLAWSTTGLADGTYYYQVCSYETSSCTMYSNVLSVTVPR